MITGTAENDSRLISRLTWHLAWRLVGARWRTALGAAVVIALFAAVPSAGLSVARSLRQASVDGAAGANGGFEVAFGSFDRAPELAARLVEVGAVPFRAETVRLSTDAAAVDTALVEVAAPNVVRGSVVEGRAPKAPNEIVVSTAVSSALDVGVGDSVMVERQDGPDPLGVAGAHIIVGVLVRPDRVAEFGATISLPDHPEFSDDLTTGYWLDWADLDRPDIDQLSVRSSTMMRSASARADDLQLIVGVRTRVVNQFWIPAGVIGVAFVTALVGQLWKRRHREDHLGMIAAGCTRRTSGATLQLALVMALSPGIGVGWGVGWAIVWVLRRRLAPLNGQYWLSVPSPGLVLWLIMTVVGLAFAAIFSWVRPDRAPAYARRPAFTMSFIAAVVAMMVGLVLVVERRVSTIPVVSGLGTALLVTGAATLALAVLGRLGSGAVAGFRSRACRVSSVTLVVGLLVALVGSAVIAQLRQQSAESLQGMTSEFDNLPTGSLQIERLRLHDADEIRSSFEDIGGTAWVFQLFPEHLSVGPDNVRVVTPDVARCFADATKNGPVPFDACPDSPVKSRVGIGEPGAETVAAPRAIQDGVTGIITWNGVSGLVTSAQVVTAQPTAEHSSWLVDAVLSGPEAERLQPAAATPVATMALLRFADYSESQKARVRSVIDQRAGYALVNETTGADDHGLGAIALTLSTAIGLVLGLGIAILWFLVLRNDIRAYVVLNQFSRRRRLATARLVAIPVAVVTASALVAIGGNAAAMRRTFAAVALTVSPIDILAMSGPGIGMVLGTLVAAWMFVRSTVQRLAPERHTDQIGAV